MSRDLEFMAQCEDAAEREFPKAPNRVRKRASIGVKAWMEKNGSKYSSAEDAAEACKLSLFSDATGKRLSAVQGETEVTAYGVGIAVTLLLQIILFFAKRWFHKKFP